MASTQSTENPEEEENPMEISGNPEALD